MGIQVLGLHHRAAAGKPPANLQRGPRPAFLPSLVLCEDVTAVDTIKTVAQRESIALNICCDSDCARRMAGSGRYQALLVDFDVPGAGHLMNVLRQEAHKLVTLALVGGRELLRSAFGVGAVLAIHKPVNGGALRSALKAAYAMAPRLGRGSARRGVRALCQIGLPGGRLVPGAVLDLAEGGACIHTDRGIVAGSFVTLRFALPGTRPELDLGAVAVWNDGARTGLRFVRLHCRHAGRIRRWISADGLPTRLLPGTS